MNANSDYAHVTWESVIPEVFEKQAALHSGKVAIVGRNGQLTYSELDRAANQVAHATLQVVPGTGGIVAILMHHDAPLIATVLGVLKAAKTVIVLNTNHPVTRLSAIRLHAKVRTVIVDASYRGLALEAGFDAEDVLLFEATSTQPETKPICAPASPWDTAFLIFTSGSSGIPKGVIQPHRTVLHNVLRFSHGFGYQPADRVLLLGSLSWGQGISTTFVTLLNGATLYPYTLHELGFVDLASWITIHAITVYISSASVFRHFTSTLDEGTRFPSVRLVRLASETVMRGDVESFRHHFLEPCIFANTYSATETGNITQYLIDSHTPLPEGVLPAGKPALGMRVLLLDDHGEPVLNEQLGHVVVETEFAAAGYWNDPSLTAAHFQSAANGTDVCRVFTGDLGRWTSDGMLMVVGKNDHHLKVRGNKIQCAEVEAILSAYPAITAAAVGTRDGNENDPKLVAYLVATNEETLSPQALRHWLAQKLPDYAIPSHFMVVQSLPLNTNGKLDRLQLDALEGAELSSAAEFVEPRSEVEKEIVAVWEALLRRKIGVHDNFFDAGGHSLLAAQALARIPGASGLTMREFFAAPTPAQLAVRLDGVRKGNESLIAAAHDGSSPVSFTQQRLWFLDRLDGGSTHYHVASAYRLKGALDRGALERAIDTIVSRHESLRTCFSIEDGIPMQVVTPHRAIVWDTTDLRGVADYESTLGELLRTALQTPFSLETGPLWRIHLILLSDFEHVFVRVFHHIISDRWSSGIFNSELNSLYRSYSQGNAPSDMLALTVQYRDFAFWQRACLEHEEARLREYWCTQLAGWQHLDIPTDHARPAIQTYVGDKLTITLSDDVCKQLSSFNRLEAVTPFMTLVTAFHVLLARISGQEDILSGTPIANRQRAEWEDLIGFFANTVVIRGDLSGQPSFREAVQRMRNTALGAFEHQDLPFEKLVEYLNPVRDLSRHPLFQVMFALQNSPAQHPDFPGVKTEHQPFPYTQIHFDLELSFVPDGDRWVATFLYNVALFTAETIQRMATHFQVLLSALLSEPDRCLWQLPMLAPDEEHQILHEWNRTARDHFWTGNLAEWITAQVRRTPDAVAVKYGDAMLRYRELESRANALAIRLRKLGTGCNVLVAVFLERSVDLVVALFAVLKAGGAYVPLDPAFPADRLSYMIADSQAPVLISQHSLATRLPAHRAQTLWMDDFAADGAEDATDTDTLPHAAPADLAYVIYTSGSTGTPKGVAIPHRALVNCISHFQGSLLVQPTDVWLAITTISFDIAALEIWLPLVSGACCVLASREMATDGHLLQQSLATHGATLFQATPATWQLLLHSGWRGQPNLQLLCGGEALPQDLANALCECSDRVWNVYGPTEATIWATSRLLSPSVRVTVGRPLANVTAYILDRHGMPVPIGVPGDLYLGGACLARGYWCQPELSAERFVPNPTDPLGSTRIYQTGDRARWLINGEIDLLGRTDSQIKIRGFRVELGDVETALRNDDDVRDAAAKICESSNGEKHLVAYVVKRPQATLDQSTLASRLSERLPDYMLPNVYVWLDALPLTQNGKVDRKALPAPELLTPKTRVDAAATNLLEMRLLQCWRHLFAREDIGIQEDFFALGGHSLLAAKLTMDISKILGRTLPIAALFQTPTIESLAKRLTDDHWAPMWSSLVPLQPLGSALPLFCVHGWGGDVYGFLDLARELAPDRPVFGLQAAGLDDPTRRHESVECMAEQYVREIRSAQPTGPYHLLGHSAGGWIAYAIAQELRKQGETVALLGLLDTRATADLPYLLYVRVKVPALLVRLRVHVQSWCGLPWSQRLAFIVEKWKWLRYHLTRGKGRHTILETIDLPPPDYFADTIRRYRPAKYHGDIHLFVGREERSYQRAFWKHMIRGRIHVHRVSGDHHSLIGKTHLKPFVLAFKQALGDLQMNDM